MPFSLLYAQVPVSFGQLWWTRSPAGGVSAAHGVGLSRCDPPALSLLCLGGTQGFLSLGTAPVPGGIMGSQIMALQGRGKVRSDAITFLVFIKLIRFLSCPRLEGLVALN